MRRLLAFFALVLAGCSTSGPALTVETGSSAPSDLAFEAAPAIDAVRGARSQVETETLRLEYRYDMLLLGETVSMAGFGAIDDGSVELSLTMGGEMFTQQLGDVGDLSIDMVMNETAMYMRSPLFAMSGDPVFGGAGNQWIRIDLQRLADETGAVDMNALGSMGVQSDPLAFLTFLEGAQQVEEVGTETIRGVETTQLHVEVRLGDAMAQADAEASQELQDMMAGFGMAGLADVVIPFDVWLDAEQRPRRFEMTMRFDELLPATDAESFDASFLGDIEMRMGMEFFDYGDPSISVTEPTDFVDLTDDLLAPVAGFDLTEDTLTD